MKVPGGPVNRDDVWIYFTDDTRLRGAQTTKVISVAPVWNDHGSEKKL